MDHFKRKMESEIRWIGLEFLDFLVLEIMILQLLNRMFLFEFLPSVSVEALFDIDFYIMN